ncbi:hypothetical protein [Conservatibacter flavescens]|uniref:hypothetical protein n=1 Tax=Conservatibacter flavescens TaxID=28161 RepID=UPI00105578B7|nr:hypothetical protein [Conservatibacter flavescens]
MKKQLFSLLSLLPLCVNAQIYPPQNVYFSCRLENAEYIKITQEENQFVLRVGQDLSHPRIKVMHDVKDRTFRGSQRIFDDKGYPHVTGYYFDFR